jgi:hypothetical protein
MVKTKLSSSRIGYKSNQEQKIESKTELRSLLFNKSIRIAGICAIAIIGKILLKFRRVSFYVW